MRLLAAVTFVLALAALLLARFVDTVPLWYWALWALPLTTTLFAVALAGAVLEHLLGAGFRLAAAALAFSLSLFATLFAIFERAPGTLPATMLPLEDLPAKAFSVTALGAAAAALLLALYALRSPSLAAQIAALLALTGSLFVARQSAAGFGLPFLSPWALAVLILAMLFHGLSGWMRRRRPPGVPEERTVDQRPPPPESSLPEDRSPPG
ncbi:MAG: hypothetical protein HY901_15250 [Deltaproteobacteria bacterium]|nr:hypothetical protein [Deltaproteobacteria bacterium]